MVGGPAGAIVPWERSSRSPCHNTYKAAHYETPWIQNPKILVEMRKVSCSARGTVGCPNLKIDHVRCRPCSWRVLVNVLTMIAAFSAPSAFRIAVGAPSLQGSVGSTGPSLTPGPRVAACGEPDISLSPEEGGLTQISVASPCRAGELVSFTYADATLVERLGADGHTKTMLDCFAGDTAPITITFEDGTSTVRQPATDDLTKYSKIAILWSSSVDLDLHAFEYAAAQDDPGHIWSGAPLSLAEAETRTKREKRGHGFLSTASAGRSIGMNVEVYTFVHHPRQKAAGVKMGVDFVSRGRRADGEYCGTDRYAEVHFKAYTLEKGRAVKRLDVAFASLPCGTDISDAARINSRLIPEFSIRE